MMEIDMVDLPDHENKKAASSYNAQGKMPGHTLGAPRDIQLQPETRGNDLAISKTGDDGKLGLGNLPRSTFRASKNRLVRGEGSLVTNPAIVDGHYKGRSNHYRDHITGRKNQQQQQRTENTDTFSCFGCFCGRSSIRGRMTEVKAVEAEAYKLTASGDSLRLKKSTSGPRKTTTILSTDHSGSAEYDVCHKILLLGDSNVGKTSILRHLMAEPFNPAERSTVAFDFVSQLMQVDGARVQLQIWDLPGQERFNTLVKYYYKDTKAVVLVYDVTDLESFIFLGDKWLDKIEKDIDKDSQEGVPVFIVGNKCDMAERYHEVTSEQGQQFCQESMCNGYFEVSAKTGRGVETMFEKVALDVTEIYTPKLMNSYLSPTERVEKYGGCGRGRGMEEELGTARVAERGGAEGELGTARVAERGARPDSAVPRSRDEKRASDSSVKHLSLLSCLQSETEE